MHKFQSVEKFSFKERRFLNMGGEKGGEAAKPQPVVAAQPAATPDKAVAGKPAVVEGGAAAQAKPAEGEKPAKAEVKPVVELVKEGKAGLKELQDNLTLEKPSATVLLQKYLDATDKIKVKEFTVNAKANALNFDAENKRIYEEIFAAYKDVDFSGLKDLFGIKEEGADFNNNVRAIAAKALANSFINKAKEDTKDVAAFLQAEAGKKFVNQDLVATFSYKEKVSAVKITGGKEFDDSYAAFVKAQPAEAAKPVDAAKAAEALPMEQREDFMAKTKIGKIMKMFGVDFKKVLNNESPIAAMIFVLLGFGPKLGLGDSDMFKDLPDTELTKGIKKTLEGLQKSGRDSAYGVDKDKVEGFNPSEVKAPSYEVYEEAKFLDTVKTGKALDSSKGGIKVEKELKLGEGDKPKSVKVDLNAGGEIIVNGAALNGADKTPVELIVNGEKVVVKPGIFASIDKDAPNIKSKGGIAELTGTIPVGVVFNNKCKFVPAVAEAVAAAPAK